LVLIALCGKANVGKSTLLNALSDAHAQTANYPFTTIDPNKGIAFVSVPCACKELGVVCKPRNSKCENGVRRVPINVVDVAGLVPGAHEGKGMGNKFLSDLGPADALIAVADCSGGTDDNGNPVPPGTHDAVADVQILLDELDYWYADVLKRNSEKVRGKTLDDLALLLSGMGITVEDLHHAADDSELYDKFWDWDKEQVLQVARFLRKKTKPLAIAANKIDSPFAEENVRRLKEAFPDYIIVPVSGDSELALKRAKELGLISYDGRTFAIAKQDINPAFKAALEKIRHSVVDKYGSTGSLDLLNKVVFGLLGLIVVYPVEDEHKYSDHFGNPLPDAILLPAGSTPVQLAAKIHTDLATHFHHAVDAKRHVPMGKDHKLQAGDVVKIVATK